MILFVLQTLALLAMLAFLVTLNFVLVRRMVRGIRSGWWSHPPRPFAEDVRAFGACIQETLSILSFGRIR